MSSSNYKSGFDAYRIYVATRLHFDQKSGYDALKFNFKIPNLTYTVYEKRPDRFYYEKLFRRFSSEADLILFYLANILEKDNRVWIGDMTDEPMVNLKSNLDSFSYRFKRDIKLLVQVSSARFDDLLKSSITSPGAPSIIMKMLAIDQTIMIETVSVIDQLVDFLRHNKKLIMSDSSLDPLGLWTQEIHKIQRYGTFLALRIDLMDAKNILIQEFTFSPNMV